MAQHHLTRLEFDRGPILPCYRPVCRCGWTGATFWSRALAERAGIAHQLDRWNTAPAVSTPAALEAGQRRHLSRRSAQI